MSRAAMQQALDAIEGSGCKADLMAAADALRAALAEQLQPLTSAKDRPGAIYVEGYGFVDERAVRAVEAEVLKRMGVGK